MYFTFANSFCTSVYNNIYFSGLLCAHKKEEEKEILIREDQITRRIHE